MTDDDQRPLTNWVALYKELCDTERLLGQAQGSDADHLRAEVARLSVELDEALGAVQRELEDARQRRP